ncbi:MAG: hypothetical protein HOG66_08440 [Flavobacteriales bacterium]|nr:hypothetical protein [Flavobacteriales bacterium]
MCRSNLCCSRYARAESQLPSPVGCSHGSHHRGEHSCAKDKAHQGVWIDKEGAIIEIQTDGEVSTIDLEGDVSAIVDEIESSDFDGDTTITAGGASIKINKDGGEIKVNVEMEDDAGNTKKVEKKIMIIKTDDD